MFRALLGSILRVLLWFFAFYLIAHFIRTVARALFGSNRDGQVDGKPRPGEVHGADAEPRQSYRDVQDASFQDLPPKDNENSRPE